MSDVVFAAARRTGFGVVLTVVVLACVLPARPALAGTRPERKVLVGDVAAGDGLGWSVAVSGDTAVAGAPSSAGGGAAYVLRRDPARGWTPVARLLPTDATPGADFGWSVGVCGDIAVVGAVSDDDGGASSGSAYVFRRVGAATWVQETKLTAPDAASQDRFGFSVTVSGDSVVVGSPYHASGGLATGAAYAFHRGTTGAWTLETEVVAADVPGAHELGYSVALSGDTAVVGARGVRADGVPTGLALVLRRAAAGQWAEEAVLRADDEAPGDAFGVAVALSGDTAVVGADLDTDGGVAGGSAYVFRRAGSSAWAQVAKLTATDAEGADHFGCAVAVSGDTALVGSRADDERGTDGGAAFVFRRQASGAWTEALALTASDGAAQDAFGAAVALSAETALVGAPLDDDAGAESGSLYVYPLEQKLEAADGEVDDRFGHAVAISGDTVLVGAPLDDGDGDSSGAAYLFRRSATGTWSQLAKLTAPDAAALDEFGFAVAISGGTAAVGARQDDDGATDTGSVHVFRRTASGTWEHEARLPGPGAPASRYVGWSVAVSGDALLLGSLGEPVSVFRRSAGGAWAEEAQLDSGVADVGASFGRAVALAGDTAVVGAIGNESAFVYHRSASGVWTREAVLTAPVQQLEEYFGVAVAVAGDTVVVGAQGNDDVGTDAGAAYLFRRSPSGTWTRELQLLAGDGAAGDAFGVSVAASGDTIVVGATGNQGVGAAYVFRHDVSGRWSQVSKLTAADAVGRAVLGGNVAVSGESVVAGNSLGEAAYVFGEVGGRAPLGIVSTSLPEMSVGLAYDIPLETEGGVRPRRFAVAWGALPPSLALDPESGRIAGTCSAYGPYAFEVRATDACGDATSRLYAVTVHPAPAIVTTALAEATVGRPCARQLAASGGVGAITWSLVGGALPVAGALDPASGAFSGQALAAGDHVFTVRATDQAGAHDEATLGVRVNPAPRITSAETSPATTGRPFAAAFAFEGGTAPFTWSRLLGDLPVAGVPDARTGSVTGATLAPGTYDATLRITDAAGATADQALHVVVAAEPRLVADALPFAVAERPYAARAPLVGGTAPFAFELTEGALPDGVLLDAATGEVRGVPAAVGRSTFRLRCTDAAGAVAERTLTLDALPTEDLAKGRLAGTLHFDAQDGTQPLTRVLELVEGTRLDVALRFRAVRAAPVTLDVQDATGASVAGDAVRRESARGASLQGIVIPTGGRYLVRVTPVAPFEGEVRLALKVTAPGGASGSVVVGDEEPRVVQFATLAGARVSVTVTPVRGGAAEPTVLAVRDASGAELLVDGDLRVSPKAAKLRMRAPAPGGTLRVTLGTLGAAGELLWRAQVKNPRGYVHSAPDLPAGDGE